MQLPGVFNLFQSVEKKLSELLSAIESTLMGRFMTAGSSLKHVHNTLSDLKSEFSDVKKGLAELRVEKKKSEIISELRSKEFKLLFHGLSLDSSDEAPE